MYNNIDCKSDIWLTGNAWDHDLGYDQILVYCTFGQTIRHRRFQKLCGRRLVYSRSGTIHIMSKYNFVGIYNLSVRTYALRIVRARTPYAYAGPVRQVLSTWYC